MPAGEVVLEDEGAVVALAAGVVLAEGGAPAHEVQVGEHRFGLGVRRVEAAGQVQRLDHGGELPLEGAPGIGQAVLELGRAQALLGPHRTRRQRRAQRPQLRLQALGQGRLRAQALQRGAGALQRGAGTCLVGRLLDRGALGQRRPVRRPERQGALEGPQRAVEVALRARARRRRELRGEALLAADALAQQQAPEDEQQHRRRRDRQARRPVAAHPLQRARRRIRRARLDRPHLEQRLEVATEGLRAGVAPGRILLQRLEQHGLEVARDPRGEPARTRGLLGQDRVEDLGARLAFEGRPARQALEQGRAERVDVGARVDVP